MPTVKKLCSQQKHAIHIIYNNNNNNNKKWTYQRTIQKEQILSLYQLNILNNPIFMNNIETNSAPNIFLSSLHIYIRLGFNARLIWSERLTKK